MERLLGEAVRADQVEKNQLVWHNGAFLLVTDISRTEDDRLLFNLLGGDVLYVDDDSQVMRGWRFLVGRRIG
jgi:hypothetical protein